jgi:DNA-binding CsgD family transcriptional regulator
MGELPLNADDPALLGALRDVDAMCLWEVIRAQRAPATLSELCALTNAHAGAVQARLDMLSNAGLVRTVRARKPRNAIGYVVTRQRLVVAFDQSDAEAVARIREISKTWERHVGDLIENHGDTDGDPRATYRSRYVGLDQLDESDFAELRRRIDSVCEFWNMLANKNGEAHPSGRRRRVANHAMYIRVEPLAPGKLPIPEAWFRPKEAAERVAADPGAGRARRPLTTREAEVARALATGLQRKQLATHLGVSIHTLTTMCKRIYAKLGVHSQAELAAVMRAPSPPPGLARTAE